MLGERNGVDDPMGDISKSMLLDLRFLRLMIMTMIMMMPDI